jgi:predicted aldo/keto reductase-like oxidoreductase
MKSEENTETGKNLHSGVSRRAFFKTAGAAGLGALLAGPALAAVTDPGLPAQNSAAPMAPAVPFGKSGVQVPVLGLGTMFDLSANQLLLKQAVNWGVTYWDTADCYQQGSESGIGKYFARFPEDRPKVFLVTKSCARTPAKIDALLDRSLQLMNTTWIDLYFMHGISSIDEMSPEVRRWAEQAKAAKKIRLFGFSTHKNIAACLQGAAALDWIDGIMMTYNFRTMDDPAMQKAVEACHTAGIGLTAMKSQAGTSWYDWSKSDPTATALAQSFRQKGWTEGQAKLKAVWRNPRIATICCQMESVKLLQENVTAAADPSQLSAAETRLFQRYAQATACNYCAGCGYLCEAALGQAVPVSHIMRDHMYCQSYGKAEWAKTHFQSLSARTRRRMASTDYSAAERVCPQRMPIGRLMRQALEDFG